MINTRKNLNKLYIEEFEKAMYNINMSVRQIKKSYISCTGYFASYKNKKQIAFESVLERDFYMLLEFDENVVSYQEQPITINYEYVDSLKRKYTPDCLVTYKDRTQIYYEVKYINEINNDEELRIKLDFLKKYFHQKYSYSLNLFTDEEIYKEELENFKFLYKFAFLPINKEKTEQINKILNTTDEITIKNILNKISSKQFEQMTFLPYIWNYVFHNLSIVNLSSKFTMYTILEKKVFI